MYTGFILRKRVLTRIAPSVAWAVVLLGILACRSCSIAPVPAEAPTPQPTVGMDELRFSDPETGARFRNIHACIVEFVDESWSPTVYHLSANYYELRWCRGAGTEPDCRNPDPSSDRRDQQSIELFTKFYNLPEVLGLGIRAYRVPETTGWKASFSFFEDNDSMSGDGWGVTFSEYTTATGRLDATISLGHDYSYKIVQTAIAYSPHIPIREDLAPYLAGPESMRDRGLTQMRALAQAVKREISAHQVAGCDWTPYQGRGIPPSCTPRPMTPAEEATELDQADAYFADQEQLLQDHYQEMYAVWMQAFPFDQCWP
jgi:hypothetical protein